MVEYSDWAVAIQEDNDTIRVITINGRIEQTFIGVMLTKYLILGYNNDPKYKIKTVKVYVKSSIKPVKIRAKIINAYIPADPSYIDEKLRINANDPNRGNAYSEILGWAVLLESKTANYIVNDLGDFIKIPDYISTIDIDNDRNLIRVFYLHPEVITGRSFGTISRDLKTLNYPNLMP